MATARAPRLSTAGGAAQGAADAVRTSAAAAAPHSRERTMVKDDRTAVVPGRVRIARLSRAPDCTGSLLRRTRGRLTCAQRLTLPARLRLASAIRRLSPAPGSLPNIPEPAASGNQASARAVLLVGPRTAGPLSLARLAPTGCRAIG